MSISSPALGLSPLPPLEPLNPSNPPQPTRVEPSNCMERIVQWLSSDETSLLIKIGAVAMAVIATVGVGILVGYPLLISAIVLIPTTIWAVVSGVLLARREIQAANAATHAVNSTPLGTLPPEQELIQNATREAPRQALRNIQEAVGGEGAFNRLPVLDLANLSNDSGPPDFHRFDNRNSHPERPPLLYPNDLTHSVMRGTFNEGRPFIAIKLRSNATNDLNPTFVMTFFQRRTGEGLWAWSSVPNQTRDQLFGNTPMVRPQDLATIQQIVVQRNHPHLSLA